MAASEAASGAASGAGASSAQDDALAAKLAALQEEEAKLLEQIAELKKFDDGSKQSLDAFQFEPSMDEIMLLSNVPVVSKPDAMRRTLLRVLGEFGNVLRLEVAVGEDGKTTGDAMVLFESAKSAYDLYQKVRKTRYVIAKVKKRDPATGQFMKDAKGRFIPDFKRREVPESYELKKGETEIDGLPISDKSAKAVVKVFPYRAVAEAQKFMQEAGGTPPEVAQLRCVPTPGAHEWMLDPMSRDQFALRVGGDETQVMWCDGHGRVEDVPGGGDGTGSGQEEGKEVPQCDVVADYAVRWSPQGTYLAAHNAETIEQTHTNEGGFRSHRVFDHSQQFVEMFGMRQPHTLRQFAYSSDETLMWTFSGFEGNDKHVCDLQVWDVLSGRQLESFPQGNPESAEPMAGFTADSKFFYRATQAGLMVYRTRGDGTTRDMTPAMDEAIKTVGITGLCCPPGGTNSLLAWYRADGGPGGVYLEVLDLSLAANPKLRVVRGNKRMHVAELRVHWHPEGHYLAAEMLTVKSKNAEKMLAEHGGADGLRDDAIDNTQIDVYRFGARNTEGRLPCQVDAVTVPTRVHAVQWEPRPDHVAWERGSGGSGSDGPSSGSGGGIVGGAGIGGGRRRKRATGRPDHGRGDCFAVAYGHDRNKCTVRVYSTDPAARMKEQQRGGGAGGSAVPGAGGKGKGKKGKRGGKRGVASAPAVDVMRAGMAGAKTPVLRELHDKAASRLAWSPAGRVLLIAGPSNSLEFYDVETGKVMSHVTCACNSLHWSPSGRVVLCSQQHEHPDIAQVQVPADQSNNGWSVFDILGKKMQDQRVSVLHTVSWRPRPAMLSDERDAAIAEGAEQEGGAGPRTQLLRKLRPDHEAYKRIDQDLENKRNLEVLVNRRSARDRYEGVVIPLDAQGHVLDQGLETYEQVPYQYSGFDIEEEEVHEVIGDLEEDIISEEELASLLQAGDES